MGFANEAIWSTRVKHSSVLSSPSYGPWTAEARQCTQARLQLRVTSQAMTRGGAGPSAASVRGHAVRVTAGVAAGVAVWVPAGMTLTAVLSV